MKINGPDVQARVRYTRSAEETKEVGRARNAGTGEAAAVRVSDGARVMGGMRAPESPDMEKVARLRAAIDSGDFKVDPEAIASRMMEEER